MVDVGVGAQWLKTLGEFCTTMEEIYLKFEEGQQLISVKGLELSANDLITPNKISKQLARNELSFTFLFNSTKGLHSRVRTQKITIVKEEWLIDEFASIVQDLCHLLPLGRGFGFMNSLAYICVCVCIVTLKGI